MHLEKNGEHTPQSRQLSVHETESKTEGNSTLFTCMTPFLEMPRMAWASCTAKFGEWPLRTRLKFSMSMNCDAVESSKEPFLGLSF